MKTTKMLLMAIIVSLLTLSNSLLEAKPITINNQDNLQVQFSPNEQFNQGQPSPYDLEQIYHNIWRQIGNMFIDHEKLKDWSIWENKFKGQLNTVEELDEAIRTMTKSLGDQWTRYISSKEQNQGSSEVRNGVIPLGVRLVKGSNNLYKIDYLDYGFPLYKSALKRGDTVIAINGVKLEGLSFKEVENLAKGRIGGTVTVTYLEFGKPFDEVLQIERPQRPQVESYINEDGILYIRLPDFRNAQRTTELLNLFGSLSDSGAVKGIIFDLRGNPGGEFNQALIIASIFLEKGLVVESTTRNGRIVTEERFKIIAPLEHTKPNGSEMKKQFLHSLHHSPMVILLDENSASASEVVTGALKDNKRATVIGKTSYGKGRGYKMANGPTGGIISITTLKYLTPSGYDLHGKGIDPDIEVTQPRVWDKDVQMEAALRFLLGSN